MKKNIILLVASCLLSTWGVRAQSDTLGYERNITLAEAIALARTQSVDAAVALNELKTAYWEYRTFRADLLPEVNFTGTLPNYNKSYSSYQNSDGSYTFVRNNTLGLSGELSIDQNIWFTGGKLSLTSSLDYVRQLGSNGQPQFMSIPIGLELTQPIFGVNNLKWNRRIEPVRYAEAKAAFISATEQVTMSTITYFLNFCWLRNRWVLPGKTRKMPTVFTKWPWPSVKWGRYPKTICCNSSSMLYRDRPM